MTVSAMLWAVTAMGAVTAAFRVVPLLVFPPVDAEAATESGRAGDAVERSRRAERLDDLMALMPPTVLTALVVPGAVTVDPADPVVGLSAAVSALLIVLIRPRTSLLIVLPLSVAAALVVPLIV